MTKTRRHLLLGILLFALTGLTGACTRHAYDLDRTSRNITLFGEDLSFPLGETGPLSIGAVLGEKMADYIVPLEDGTCAIQYKGKAVNFTFNELKNIDGAAPFQRFCDFPINFDFFLFDKPANPTFDTHGETDLSSVIPKRIEIQRLSKSLDLNVTGLPAQLASLKSITLSQKSRIEITVSLPDCPFTSGTITPDITFDMGRFFESEDFPGGIVRINAPMNSGNGYSATTTIPLHKFALSPENFNPADHSLAVSAALSISGACTVTNPRTTSDRLAKAPQQTSLHVTVIMRDIACQEIEGTFSYAKKSQVSVQLADLSASLTDKLSEDIHFDFMDPTILLDIESNVTIPISARLEMAARQNGVPYAEIKDVPVAFPVAAPGAMASKRLRLAKNPVPSPDEEAIALDFTSLFSRMPDDLLITVNGTTQSDKTAVLRIGENYRVSVSPQIIIPLYLGPDTRLAIRDTVALPAQLGAIIRQNSIQVKGTVDNGFPLQFSFSLMMVAEDGTPLTDTVLQTLPAGTSSQLEMSLALLPATDSLQLASAVFSFQAEGIPESRPVRTDDTIQAKLHVVIPQGVHLDL